MTEALPQEKRRYARSAALAVVRELLPVLQPACSRIIVAGSLRRGREEVGDIEFVYIPQIGDVPDPDDFFGRTVKRNLLDAALKGLLAGGILAPRTGLKGGKAWGENIKLAVHCASGIPVDLFAANLENWFSLLVCRTGPLESNIEICEAAVAALWKWSPNVGFVRPNPERIGWSLIKEAHSEREVFEFVNLPYREPQDR